MTYTGTDWQSAPATKAARLAAVDAMPPAKPSLLTARDAVALELHGKRYAELPLLFLQLDVDAEVARRLTVKDLAQ